MSATTLGRLACTAIVALGVACTFESAPSATQANAGIDSLNARLVRAYQTRDAQAYAALFTDSAVFEWPAFNTVRGPVALGTMARSNWAGERDVDLRLAVTNRRLTGNQATEFGAFQQYWTDSAGSRMIEFGRYATVLVRQNDGSWRIDRFLGFEDSTRKASGAR